MPMLVDYFAGALLGAFSAAHPQQIAASCGAGAPWLHRLANLPQRAHFARFSRVFFQKQLTKAYRFVNKDMEWETLLLSTLLKSDQGEWRIGGIKCVGFTLRAD
jgi:hypothetical protein